MNFLDRTIAYIAPDLAARRMRARVLTHIHEDQLRRYEAAGRGRRTTGLPKHDGSANTATAVDLVALRAGSRDMGRNNPYAKKAVQSITANTIGTGIQPSPKVDGRGKAKIATIKKAWKDWAESTNCDFEGQKNFYGIQRLVMRTVVEAGECLVLKRRVKNDSGVPIQLQILDPDFLDNSKDYRNFSRNGVSGGYITQGVEFDKNGKRVGYWLYDKHPGEFGTFGSRFVSADEVIHVYEVLRPGQVRGVPFGSSAMLRLKDFDDYEDAEVVRQKIAACFVAFVQDADPSIGGAGGASDDMLERMEPGVIEHLPPGKTVTLTAPPVTSNYDPFSRKMLQGAAAGYGSTYESLSGDLSNVNFSSGRMGWIEQQRQIEIWQYDMIIPQLCDKAWGWFIGGLEIAMLSKTDGVTISWTPPRREMIEPVKETTAIVKMVRAGLKSWSEAVREMGYEPEDVLSELAADMTKIKGAGLVLDIDGSVPLNQQQAAK